VQIAAGDGTQTSPSRSTTSNRKLDPDFTPMNRLTGQLAQQYVDRFDQRWVRGNIPLSEPLLGSADIQSLADLGNSYALVREMRPVPFSLEDISRMAAVTASPFLPLLLTIWSPEELIKRIVQVVF